MLLNVVVHRASIQDRDGTRRLLRNTARRFPSIVKIFADAGYRGPRMAKVVADTGRLDETTNTAAISASEDFMTLQPGPSGADRIDFVYGCHDHFSVAGVPGDSALADGFDRRG